MSSNYGFRPHNSSVEHKLTCIILFEYDLYMIVKGKIGFAKLTRQFAFCLPTCSCRARGGAASKLLLQSNSHAICSTRFRLFFVSSNGHEVAPMYCYRDRYSSNSAFRKNSVLFDVGIVNFHVLTIANMVFYFAKNVAVFGT